ncbi:hypothetical protein VCUG_02474 [Vavraia culicis subsp. floridensis]|uniref:DNA-directed RNA polymerase I, II, and III subunit RPABC4 n=1 Tax=Vavraia culicis (isolate floridensis) TaxID=948595 RepID=L2GQW1_VAVCU|nr:uncharacterized protein VCUG_02474 [Vavraia culicis subsp. floridensis]ELA46036.1 hypothetical protein VCUG_02474 [Vavraia culicis subsp. floridensis]
MRDEQDQRKMYKYQCKDCKKLEVVGPKDPIRCSSCGCRIFYKLQKDETTQYDGC